MFLLCVAYDFGAVQSRPILTQFKMTQRLPCASRFSLRIECTDFDVSDIACVVLRDNGGRIRYHAAISVESKMGRRIVGKHHFVSNCVAFGTFARCGLGDSRPRRLPCAFDGAVLRARGDSDRDAVRSINPVRTLPARCDVQEDVVSSCL